MSWKTVNSAQELPFAWDDLAAHNIFLKKSFLSHLETVNPSDQGYHLLYEDELLKAIYVDYSQRIDIFTYSKLRCRYPVRVLGIPCSVSKQGFASADDYIGECVRHFQKAKGASLIINSDKPLCFHDGDTLPTLRLELPWANFETYLCAMRSHYRYRWQKAMAKWKGVTISCQELSTFTQDMYALYETVYQRSSYKLEKLSLEFFRDLTLPAKLIVAHINSILLGFAIVVENDTELIFLFTGFDYALSSNFDTYHNLLLEVIRYGFRNHFTAIELGQTAEDTKVKLGCSMKRKYLSIHHSNEILNQLAKKFIGLLSYRVPDLQYNVFKEQP